MFLKDTTFTEQEVFLGLTAEDDHALLQLISTKMMDSGLVTADFPQAIIEREEKYPTGLSTKGLGVAMPHTEADHVLRESFSVTILREPVVFREMGNSANRLPVHIIFMLALKNPQTQLNMLQGIVHMIQKPEFLEELYREQKKERIHQRILEELETLVLD